MIEGKKEGELVSVGLPLCNVGGLYIFESEYSSLLIRGSVTLRLGKFDFRLGQ